MGRPSRAPKGVTLGPSLLLVSKEEVDAWMAQANSRVPSLRVANYTGTGRDEEVGEFTDYQLVVTTYDTLTHDIEEFCDIRWDYVVLDTAEMISDANSHLHRLLGTRGSLQGFAVKNRHKNCLMGRTCGWQSSTGLLGASKDSMRRLNK